MIDQEVAVGIIVALAVAIVLIYAAGRFFRKKQHTDCTPNAGCKGCELHESCSKPIKK